MVAVAATKAPAWRLRASQDRSLETEEAIRVAARALLTEQSFDDIRVSDIAGRAGVSVGGFYRRFRDKRAVLHLADESFLEDCTAAFDERMTDDATETLGLRGVAHRYIELMVGKFREHRMTILQIVRHADPQDGAFYAERAQRFNQHVHGRFRDLLRQRRAEIRHPDLERALNLAIFFASAAARDAVWRASLVAYPIRVDGRELVAEITRAFCAYLGSRA